MKNEIPARSQSISCPILNHTKRGQLVYEPFLGSGTTLAAAELTERVCCGLELDPKYVDVVVQRWQTLSGKKAKLDGDGRTLTQFRNSARRRPYESRAAAGGSRPSKLRYGPAIPISRGCVWHWQTGQENGG